MNTMMKQVAALALAGASLGALAQAPVARPLALEAAADYRARAELPDHVRLLQPGDPEPIKARREIFPSTRRGPGGEDPALSVWTSDLRFEAGDTALIYARLHRLKPGEGEGPLAALRREQPITASFSGEVVNAAGATWGALRFRDDGKDGDRLAGDGVYTAAYTLPAARQPAAGQAENLMLKLRAVLADGNERRHVGGLLYSHPGAVLTGRYRDELRDGHLQVLAEVEVRAEGRYQLAGSLAKPAGRAFAYAQTAEWLSPGRHWLVLDYPGLLFHKALAAGAFSLAAVTLTSAQGMPNALGPVLEQVHQTRSYRLAQFSRRSPGQPALLDAARRLEASVAGPR